MNTMHTINLIDYCNCRMNAIAATLTGQLQAVLHATIHLTIGYAMWFTAGGAIRIAHYDIIDDVITRKLYQIEKNGDHSPHEIL